AVNHGGQASGFTVPNPARQTDLLVEAYGTAGVKPETIGYIETHGTGTPLGDPIEVRGIKDAFSQLAELKEANSEAYCGLGSVKTNIGHLEAAAGIAGLLKVILCFKHQTLPASLNFHEINPSIYLDKTPFYIVTKNRHWDLPAGQSLRRAGVSSFGSGGTNAHVVLEESPVTYESSPKVFPYYLICLSAKNKTALQQREKDLLGWLDEEGRAESLADISATLLGGRDHFKLRASFVASSIQELKKKLQEVLKKGQAPGYLEGTAGQEGPESACRELARKTLAEIEANGQFDAKDYLRQLTVLAELYVKGYDWDDRAVPGGSTAARISLPAYPFAKERYWIPEPDRQSDVTDTALNLPVSRIHPLLHPNTADFCERQSSSILTGNVLLVPTWDPVLLQPKQNGPAPTTRVIIVGGTKANWEAIQQIYPRAQALEFDAQATIEAIEKKLDQGGPVEHIIWLVANPSLDSLADEALIEEQNQGVLLGLRMIKALLNLGYGTRDLGWTVITIQTQSLHGHEAANPTHVSLYGLLNSMAREYPNWKSRILDLEANCDWPIADIFGMPADLQGDAFIYRGRKWYRQSLIPARYPATGHTLYKSSGVYVVIGGAGGIGRLWSEYVIRTYQAQVIWIGRRPKDDVIQAKMDRLAALGPIPYYIAADATDLKALRRAYDEIKRRYAKINGVIHSAVGMLDQSLANMKEEHFKAGLSAKIDIGVRIVQVFQAEPLDFIMFFSSIVTFLKEYGKSSYVAGCSFSDAYARQLAREMPWAVKTINWGYWGGVGIASLVPAAFKNRLAQSGIGSIEPEEALQIMETVLAGSLNQIAVLKTTEPLALENLNIDEEISDYPKGISVNMEYIRKFLNEKSSVLKLEQPELRQPIREMEALLAKLLWTQLQSLGLFWKENMAIGDFKAKIGMCDRYSRWLDESIAVLTQNNYLKYHDASDTVSNHALLDVNAVWQEWDSQKALWVEDPDLKAKVILIEAMLKALPEILSGKLLATDVMFPNSSLELVEGVYTDNIVADY
ncbi:MAG: SDR family NAD(P)-dependent oxidoreductase, partial [Bacillota bacterium]